MPAAVSISKEEFAARLERVRQALGRRGLDGLVVLGAYPEQEGDVTYLCGFRQAYPKVLGSGGAGCQALVLGREGLATLVSPTGYQNPELANLDGVRLGPELVAELATALRDKGLANAKVGVAGWRLTPVELWRAVEKALPKAAFEAADELLQGLRGVKSPAEIGLLARAARVGAAAAQAGLAVARPGTSEAQVEEIMRQAAAEAGAEVVARVGVQSGAALRLRGWPPVTGRALADGDLVQVEIAGWAGGYAFSAARVQAVGAASPEQAEHLAHLGEAVEWMRESLQPERPMGFVMTVHREQRIMPAAHGIGLDIFEHPWILPGPGPKKQAVPLGGVLCVEPVMTNTRFGSVASKRTVLVEAAGPRFIDQ